MIIRIVRFLLIPIALLSGCAMESRSDELSCLTVEEALAKSTSSPIRMAVCGHLRYGPEDRNLYASEAVANNHSRGSCLSLGESSRLAVNLESYDRDQVKVIGLVQSDFCPEDAICLGSCSSSGMFVEEISLE